MRYFIELSVGHAAPPDAIRLPGRSHRFRDGTDEPFPAVVASRPVYIAEAFTEAEMRNLWLVYRRPPHAITSDPLLTWLDPQTKRKHNPAKNLAEVPAPTVGALGIQGYLPDHFFLVQVPDGLTEAELKRYLIERSVGLPLGDTSREVSVPGFVRKFVDRTEEPMQTITNQRVQLLETEDGAEESDVTDGKPPYRVESMAEIQARPRNGLKLVSTFSGCGGSCLGFEMAGYEVLWANEFIAAARDTYALNHPGVILDGRDIRTVQAEEILQATGLQVGELDVLEGSPPCASFSTAGKRARDWGKEKKYSDAAQRTDDLFFEYVRLLEGLKPRAFVAENVSGLVKGVAKGYFLEILRAMKAAGYRVTAKLLDAQWLGVPQMRQRIIFIGVREDQDFEPVFPTPLPYRYSVRDAIGDLTGGADLTMSRSGHGWFPGGDHNLNAEPAPTLPATEDGAGYYKHQVQSSVPAFYPDQVISGHAINRVRNPQQLPDDLAPSLEGYSILPEWERLKPGEASEKYFNLVRTHPDKPLQTLTASGGGGGGGAPGGVASVTHFTEPRKFTIAELRRICSFPDDFVLTGSYAQQWERLGRSVPPVMMKKIAEALEAPLLAAKGRSG